MNKIQIAGIGPGTQDYLLPITKRIVEESDILIGGGRALELFSELDKETMKITSDLTAVKDYIKNNYQSQQIVVLVSGDPGLYSILKYLKRYFTEEELEVIPGISAMQLGFAKAKMVWQDAKITSLHGSGNKEQLLNLVQAESKVAFFTDNQLPPQEIADYLLEQGLDKQGMVAENLSYPSERVVQGSLEKISSKQFGGLSVMVIYDE
ncbi:precorrin-6y C5,15-methyltransferase (decarboxylating) subunit CbiE [Halanaerobacter jeridensis]|uniref:Cobalt-precorrin-7 (C5)-methyltransferase n=1 Tax=Halanaerobacter jeridensis TaxID=706427 RepID=A0A938XT98_9FIRM|nr:precorrin-6y C5,15-methyltransferase (decarboxylating) subunit CbiE [Halanaerobacter jeridensis]MBM7557125.1 cobalt-precorrin-7 (C5)-methyltransferase [Halanaerobacter jeridensis]